MDVALIPTASTNAFHSINSLLFSRNLVSTNSIAPCSVYKPYTTHNSSIRSDEGLTLETSAFQSLYGGQFTSTTPLINQIFVYHSPTDAATRFLQKLISFTHLLKCLRSTERILCTSYFIPAGLGCPAGIDRGCNTLLEYLGNQMQAIN